MLSQSHQYDLPFDAKYLIWFFKALAAFQDYLYFFLVTYVWNILLIFVLRASIQVEWTQVTISFK